jgi:ribose/xylose/arabinose/galactoside ABC-type transport system permease subunit
VKARPPVGILVVILLVLITAVTSGNDARGVWRDRTPGHLLLALAEMLAVPVALGLAAGLWTRRRRLEPLVWTWAGLMTFQATYASAIYTPADARRGAALSAFVSCAVVVGLIAWFARRWLVRAEVAR